MNPLFFGRTAQQLFGAYEPPETRDRSQGIVICPAIGDEYLVAHATTRLLARQLAAAGYHVLRFDYFGTGDSACNFEDASQEQWLDDVETAIAEVKDLGQVSHVGLVGIRYGGALAACVARNRTDIRQLVLWDVVTSGAAYLEEISAPSPIHRGPIDAASLSITPLLRTGIGTVTAESFAAPLPRTLIVASSATIGTSEPLFRHLQVSQVDCVLRQMADDPAWRERRDGAGAMPVATVREIVTWLT